MQAIGGLLGTPLSGALSPALGARAMDFFSVLVGRPTGNAVAERLIRTMKEECIWLRDWSSLAELRVALLAWLFEHNERRPHQPLD